MTDTALLIIDMQIDVVTGPRPAARLDTVLHNLNQAIATARARGIPVVFIQHDEPDMPKGSPGWQLHPALTAVPDDLYVDKRYGDSFCATDLATALDRLGIKRLWIGGCATDFCVDSTVRNAVSRGYQVTVLGDAHTTPSAFALTGDQVIAHFNAIWDATDATPEPLLVLATAAL